MAYLWAILSTNYKNIFCVRKRNVSLLDRGGGRIDNGHFWVIFTHVYLPIIRIFDNSK